MSPAFRRAGRCGLNGNGRRTVLVVDDSPADIALLSETLREEYVVLCATNAARAMEILHSSSGIDLMLLDIMMPGLDGLEFCRQLRADPTTRRIPVIFVTARDADEDEASGFAAGGVDYVMKPVNPHLLRARVRTHIELKLIREDLESQNRILTENANLREEVEHLTRHDLKNPLMVILNIPTLLMRRPDLREDEKKWLRMIVASARRMLEIINMSSGLFQMERGTYVPHCEPVDALAVARQVVESLTTSADTRSCSVEITLAGRSVEGSDSCMVSAEEPLLYTMLTNLVRNALEASPEGGRVSLSFSSGTACIMSIHNSGAIPEVLRERFFEKFATSRKQGGTGLGVYSARLIARTLGGTIGFETSEEAGTTLTVSLPVGPAQG